MAYEITPAFCSSSTNSGIYLHLESRFFPETLGFLGNVLHVTTVVALDQLYCGSWIPQPRCVGDLRLRTENMLANSGVDCRGVLMHPCLDGCMVDNGLLD